MSTNQHHSHNTAATGTPSLVDAERAVNKALCAASDTTSALTGAVTALCEHLQWSWGAYWHFDATNGLLQRLATWCSPALAQSAIPRQRVIVLSDYSDEDVMIRALKSRQSALIATPDETASRRAVLASGAGMQTMLLIPVTVDNACSGLLELFGPWHQHNPAALLSTATAIGNQVGHTLQRTTAEKDYREAAEQLTAITDHIPATVFRIAIAADQAMRISFVSDSLLKFFGITAAAAIADFQVLHGSVCDEYRTALVRSFETARNMRQQWDFEFEINHQQDNARRWLRAQATPQYHDDGSMHWNGILIDITEHKEGELELMQRNLQLEERVAQSTQDHQHVLHELETFAYSVSHDLRAPLRAINGFSRILLSEHGESAVNAGSGHLKRIEAASEQMGKLVDILLALSRITRQPMTLEAVDLSALAGGLLNTLRQKQPRDSTKTLVQPDMICRADPHMIRTLLENLLGNAWKFSHTHTDPKIEFGTVSQGNEMVYYIRDNGIGFDEKFADRLFEPFQRLHDNHEFEGLGAGLAAVQRIARRHGGKVWAKSESGAGATFFFTLAKQDLL